MILKFNLSNSVGTVEVELTDKDSDVISHAICMGIRKGLFGKDAGENASLSNVMDT